MAEIKAIGVLETKGFTPLIEGADAAVKAANVDVVEWRQVGSGYVSFVVEGEVSAVRSAIDTARGSRIASGHSQTGRRTEDNL
jgi:ethanolamine utilization protein EutM